ncbi:MAG TPA: hypothetical protein VII81_00740, partial [Terriglobales bacterium]
DVKETVLATEEADADGEFIGPTQPMQAATAIRTSAVAMAALDVTGGARNRMAAIPENGGPLRLQSPRSKACWGAHSAASVSFRNGFQNGTATYPQLPV